MNQYMQQGYNPYVQQQVNNRYSTFQSPYTSGINWVQGIEGAKAIQLKPNDLGVFLDSENEGVMYIKTSDNVGMCTLRTFKFTEVTPTKETSPQIDLSEYVKKSELESLINKMLGGESNA